MCLDVPFPVNHLQPKALEQLVDLLLLMFPPHQNTEYERAELFESVRKKSVKIMPKTKNRRSLNYIVFYFTEC